MHRPFFSVPDAFFGDVPDRAFEASEFYTNMDPRCRPYMQDVNPLLQHMGMFKKWFKPSDLAKETLNQIEMPEGFRICAHVRLGDKINDPGTPNIGDYFVQPSIDWYKAGITQLVDDALDRGGEHPAPQVCLFSDSIDYVKEQWPGASFYGDGVEGLQDWKPGFDEHTPMDWIDFFCMTRCDAFVISGSTMGIWAALLSGSNQVIRPDKVYGPALSFVDSELLFPKDWKVQPIAT